MLHPIPGRIVRVERIEDLVPVCLNRQGRRSVCRIYVPMFPLPWDFSPPFVDIFKQEAENETYFCFKRFDVVEFATKRVVACRR